MNDKGTPLYLATGVRKVATESSVLVSSSKYLNSSRLREWMGTNMLRRNGRDRPTASDNIGLVGALDRIRNSEEVEALFEEERAINPRFGAWLDERFMSTYELEDLKDLPPGSIGHSLYRFVVDAGAKLDIVPRAEPKDHFDFYTRRHLQTHDFEHIITGGLFNGLGELVPQWMNMTNMYKHLSPELAGELNIKYLFNAMRVMSRIMLHYRVSWPSALECIQQGIRIGLASEPIFMFKYEPVLALTPDEAREELGVRHAYDIDSEEVSAIFDEVLAGSPDLEERLRGDRHDAGVFRQG